MNYIKKVAIFKPLLSCFENLFYRNAEVNILIRAYEKTTISTPIIAFFTSSDPAAFPVNAAIAYLYPATTIIPAPITSAI